MTAMDSPPRPAVDFRIYTAGLEALPGNVPRLGGVGSSTAQDLDGDVIDITALNDLQAAPPNLTIFLNHLYAVPEDVLGGLTGATMTIANGIADLAITFDVEQSNPRAMATYQMAQTRRLGISVGCSITDYAIEDGPDGAPVLHVKRVYPLEWSVVGMPANQRCWVEHAAAGLFARTYDPALAPIAKGLMPVHYGRAVEALPDDQRAAFTDLPARVSTHGRLAWWPARKAFTFQAAAATREREVTREQVAGLLRKTAVSDDAPAPHAVQPTPTPDLTRAATGKTTWPLAPRDHPWDGGAAHGRLLEWAGGKGDLDVVKFASVHFFTPDGDAAQNVSEYKLAFCDVIGGTVQAVPRAIFACAGAHGVEATTGISASDKDAIKAKITTYYHRMADEFSDPSITPPWETKAASGEEMNEHTDAAAPTETLPDVTLAAQGSHDPFAGTHEHAHSAFGDQGGDATHTHAHTHENDARHEPRDGAHDHAHKAAPTPEAAEAPMIHAAADPPVVAPPPAPAVTPAPAADPQRAALLAAYHALGAQLGITPQMTKADDAAPDWQQAVTLASSVDGLADALTDRVCFLNMQIDALLDCLGVPDIDPDADPDDLAKALRLRKAGKTHSRATMTQLMIAHHAVSSLTGGDLCKAFISAGPSTADDDAPDAEMPDTAAPFPGMPTVFPGDKAFSGVSLQLAAVAEALKGVDPTAIADSVKKAVEAKVAAATGELVTLTTNLAAARNELAETQAAIRRLTTVPLGNPLGFQRSVTPADAARYGLATPADMLSAQPAPALTADAAWQQSSVTRTAAGTLVRHWPAGVMPRPTLTYDQDRFMSETAVMAYRAGAACDVPEPEPAAITAPA